MLNFIKNIIDSYKRTNAITKADLLKKQTNRKHYVLLVFGEYKTFNRQQIVNLKNKKIVFERLKNKSLKYNITKRRFLNRLSFFLLTPL